MSEKCYGHFFFKTKRRRMARLIQSVTEKIYNTLANHAEDKQMMEKLHLGADNSIA